MGCLAGTKFVSALGLVCLVAGGCAVLTVDVDVYKGPLANSEKIQGEQVISLVMGAKPVLVQLRDHLENESPPYPVLTTGGHHGPITPGMALEERLYRFRANPWYVAGYIPTNGHAFVNEFALRVNDILGLYGDLNQELPDDVAKARQLADRYEENRDIVHPMDSARGKRVWERIKQRISPPPNNGLTPEMLKNLKGAYEEFFLATNTEFQSNIFRVFPQDMKAFPPGGDNANKEFEALLNGRAEKDANLLFPTNAEEKQIFITYAKRVSNAFLESRADLRRLLQFALRKIPEVHESKLLSGEKRAEIQSSVAKAASKLTKIQFLAHVLTSSEAPVEYKQLNQAYSTSLASTPGATNLDALAAGGITNNSIWSAAESALANILATNDGQFSATILRIDDYLALDAEIESMPEYRFGLGRGPLLPRQAVLSTAVVDAMMRRLENLAGGILAHGRPALGIETLIEQYLQVPNKQDVAQAFKTEQFQQLLDSLVEFGEKVTTLGNSATLLKGGNSPEVQDYVTVLQSVGNSIIVYVDELKQWSSHDAKLQTRASMMTNALSIIPMSGSKAFDGFDRATMDAKDAAEQLVTVLRAEYIKALRDGSGLESATNIGSAGFTAIGAGNSVTGVVTSVVALGKSSATNTASQPLSGAAGGSSNTATATITITNSLTAPASADKYLQAIEQAIELQSGMIYLRPASSYLRSSYPASTLQRNRSQAWRNMLLEHGMRQVPLVGGLLSGDINENSPTIAQIDQQSWQGINHVRVSGAGSANYVIAKDDVGNWYVKNFSAIPTNIFNSMRNLAFFSAGNAFGSQLPIRRADGSLIQDTNTVLATQLAQAGSKYHDNTTNTFYRLTDGVASLSSDVTNSWGNVGTNNVSPISELNSNAFLKVLTVVRNATNSVTKAKDKGSETAICDQGALDILRAVKRYYTSLSLGISQNPSIDATTKINLKEASRSVVRDFLDEFSNQREQDLGRYESALGVIDGATSAK